MTPQQIDKERIFTSALEIEDPAQRRAFLEAACGQDGQLLAAVELLLKHDEEAGSFIERPAVAAPRTIDFRPVTEGAGTVIGPYKLLQTIGEGGFGVVYMAEQQQPVRRKVALKIIKPGMDTREVIARFESERQALALMDHPNIARVFDAGATESGRPYFVMELVKGVPITDFCDRNHMPSEQRLKLFVDVCHAIQHAHHKGIIHRDVKPSNVLVTLHDGVPVVKVIDFGVAKATSQCLTERTLFTAFGQMVGTPAYMSPEQAEMSGLDIDTRSDIYSLGVLLYELLTGTTPLDIQRLRAAGFAEMQRLIREEEAPRPSNRLSSLGDSATVLAGNRGTDRRQLVRLLAGDLDWIVMKSLDKDRNRRYDTPGNFAADIERYLRRDAILARPPSATYKLHKFFQRNRTAVLTAAAMLLMLLATLGLTVYGYLQINRALGDRNVAYQQLQEEQRKTDEARRTALAKADEIRIGLENLNAANVLVERGRAYIDSPHQPHLIMTSAAQALASFDRAVVLRPDHSIARDARGRMLCRLGLFAEAAPDVAQAYALRPPTDDTLDSWSYDVWFRYACLRAQVGDLAGYRKVCADMHQQEISPSDVGGASYWMARTCVLAPGAMDDPQEVVRLAQAAVEKNKAKENHFALGMAHYRAGQTKDALAALNHAQSASNVWEAEIQIWTALALVHHELGNETEALDWLDKVDRQLEAWMDPRQSTAFALPLPWWQDWAAFGLLYRETTSAVRGDAASNHPLFLLMEARANYAIRRFQQAELGMRQVVKLRPTQPQHRWLMFRLHSAQGNWEDAAADHDRLLKLDPNDVVYRLRCGDNYARYGMWKEAADDYNAALAIRPHTVPLNWFEHTLLDLMTGDTDGYLRHCQQLHGVLGDKPKDTQIVFAAHACVLAPGALNDTAAVVALAQQRLTLKHLQPGDLPFARHVLSLARYRAGQFAEVRDELAASDRGPGDDAPALLDGFLRAMNYQQLGLRTEALQTYEATAQRISRLGAGRPPGAWQFHPRGWIWRDWLAVVILKAEAESLLGASPLKSNRHQSSDAIRSQITRDARSQRAAMP